MQRLVNATGVPLFSLTIVLPRVGLYRSFNLHESTSSIVCEHISIQIRSLCGDTISRPLNVFQQLYLKRTVTDTINWIAVKQ